MWSSSQVTVSDDVTSQADQSEPGLSQLLLTECSTGSPGVIYASPTREFSSNVNSPIRSSQGSSHASPASSTLLTNSFTC